MFSAGKSGGVTAPTDPYFQDVTLLLTGDGTNGAQNNTFIDSSSNNFTITRNGNTTQGSFSPYGNLWSNYFNGSSYLAPPSNAVFQFDTGDFCFEAWIFPTDTSTYRCILGQRTGSSGDNSWVLVYNPNNANGWGYIYMHTDATAVFGSFTAISANSWTHVVLTCSSGRYRIFQNGVLTATTTGSFNFNQNTGPRIGSEIRSGAGSASPFIGNISNTRITKASIPANYQTSSTTVGATIFTPSTTPLTAISGTSLLTCQSNRFIDNSSNNFALTVNGTPSVQRFSPFQPTSAYSASVIGGSGYFNGTSPTSLSIPYSANYATFTGDFTIECWAYEISHVNYTALISSANSGTGYWFFGYSNSQNLSFFYNGTFYFEIAWQKLNRWSHVAVTRSGSTIRLYIDGTLQSTATLSGTINGDSSNSAVVGHRWTNTNEYFWNGYIADIRILNGTALYTGSTYTIPTAPLTAVTNTSLLLNMTNAGIPDAAMMNDLETVGNAQVSTTVKKYGTGSLSFDGSGDWLSIATSPNLNFGTGDFTIEFWWYANSLATFSQIVSNTNDAGVTGVGEFVITYNTTVGLRFYINAGATDIQQGSTSGWSAGQWYHVAAVRNGNTLTLYRNGTSIASGSVSSVTIGASVPYYIGGEPTQPTSINGYIDDLRITKGYARYTANFTPPTAALPTY